MATRTIDCPMSAVPATMSGPLAFGTRWRRMIRGPDAPGGVRGLDELARAQRDDAPTHDARDARPEIDHQPEPELERRHRPTEDHDDEQEGDGRHGDDCAGQPRDERVEDAAVVAGERAYDRADERRAERAEERREHRLAQPEEELRQEVVADDVGAEEMVRRREGRLRLVDELEELLACRVRRDRRREQAGDEEREQHGEGRDAGRPAPEARDRLAPGPAPTHARADELETVRECRG